MDILLMVRKKELNHCTNSDFNTSTSPLSSCNTLDFPLRLSMVKPLRGFFPDDGAAPSSAGAALHSSRRSTEADLYDAPISLVITLRERDIIHLATLIKV